MTRLRTRVRLAWHVLRGQPLIFGCAFNEVPDDESIEFNNFFILANAKNLWVTDNTFNMNGIHFADNKFITTEEVQRGITI